MSSSGQLGPRGQRIAAAVVCLVFISVGLALWIPGFLLPTLDWSARRKWREVPCTVIQAPMEGGAFELRYHYDFDDQPYEAVESAGMGFFETPSDLLFKLKAGEQTVCYVNPRSPREAVLRRDFDPELFIWCAPLLFVILPLLALGVSIVRWIRPPEADVAAPPADSVVLRSTSRRGCGFVVQVVFLLIMGGLLALLVLLPGFRESLVVRLIYMVPVGFFTLVLLYSIGLTLLRSLQPSVTLTVVPGEGAPGGTIDVRWDARGSTGGVKRFQIALEGREETSGGKGPTRREPFARVDVFQGGAKDFKRGSVKVRVPPGSMHSMEHGTRKVVWAFQVTAEVSGLPNLFEEYPYAVVAKSGEVA
jgi:hypothetical protein